MFGTALLRNLAPLSECANYLIKTVDPKIHSKMVALREKMIRESAHVQAICSISPSLHTTLGIIVNRISGRHTDSNDAKGVWAVMFALGNFTGGEVLFDMGEKKNRVMTRFRSGDVILLKAANVYHEVRHWDGDLRVTVVYYSKNFVWTEYNAL
jgi:hypothetical protein